MRPRRLRRPEHGEQHGGQQRDDPELAPTEHGVVAHQPAVGPDPRRQARNANTKAPRPATNPTPPRARATGSHRSSGSRRVGLSGRRLVGGGGPAWESVPVPRPRPARARGAPAPHRRPGSAGPRRPPCRRCRSGWSAAGSWPDRAADRRRRRTPGTPPDRSRPLVGGPGDLADRLGEGGAVRLDRLGQLRLRGGRGPAGTGLVLTYRNGVSCGSVDGRASRCPRSRTR